MFLLTSKILAVQSKDLELEGMYGQCKELHQDLEKAAKEKEELASQQAELMKMKESMEADLNCQLTAAIESRNNLELQGTGSLI